MTRLILLDSGVLGLLTHPRPSADSQACSGWLRSLAALGDKAFIPEVTDYEVRREYLRRNNMRALRLLDGMAQQATFLPLKTAVWRRAAALWATARQQGRVTAPPWDLDIDMILAAQAQALLVPGAAVVIATTNVRHLAPFADARRWQDIS